MFGQAVVDLPPVHLAGIGREQGGAAIGQVLRQVLEPIFRSVINAATDRRVDLSGARQEHEQRARQRVEEGLGRAFDRFTESPGAED